MDKKTRSYEEIITLQDKAIEALTQANAALVMALETLKKARAEHGFPVQLPGLGAGVGVAAPVINPMFISNPNTVPGIQWTSGQIDAFGGLVTNTTGETSKTVTAQSIISQAHSQKDLANAYISGFQAWQQAKKEQNDVSKVGGCVSVSQSVLE